MYDYIVAETNASQPVFPEESNSKGSERFASLRGKRVVIVEDEALTLLQLRKILTRAGCQVVGWATNGVGGVEAALRERPDLILMDINMPSMSGLDAAEQILKSFAVCVVMLTAFIDDDNRFRAQQIGASGYITKPIDSAILLPQLETMVSAYDREKRQPLQ